MLANTFSNLYQGFDLFTSIFSQFGNPKPDVAPTVVTKFPDKIFIYDVTNEDGAQAYYASPLPYEHALANGVPPEAVMGELTNGPDKFNPESFEQNPSFLEFLAGVICKHSVNDPDLLLAETERQQDGYVYLFGKRSPTLDDRVPPEEIMGGVEIKHGLMHRFHASPNYRLLTQDGFLHLDDWLYQRLIAELVALSNAANEDSEIARDRSSQWGLPSETRFTYARKNGRCIRESIVEGGRSRRAHTLPDLVK